MDNLNIGIAGELRVMSELLLRGKNPAKSYLDKGIDCILENGKTIQIKTSRIGNREKVYTFTFRDYMGKAQELNVNFVICWCVEDNIFLIIPSNCINGKKCIRFTLNSTKDELKLKRYINNWESLN